ncbi:MAG: hypothetical protein CMP91_00660 [Gammaproteobacteria bacterium]|nr:hypothetical protein [Gammaproteobacteria bacterium]|tara:strand:- start:1320 stop:1919 length:600 start_codon:yes stop_codon:yes gene_type:complete
MIELVLASASPRRRTLLQELGIEADCRPQAIDESPLPGESPQQLVSRLALVKARSALGTLSDTDHRPVLGSDTIVVCDEEILGKPLDREDGCRMLRLLSGREHQVLTAVAVVNHEQEELDVASSKVSFKTLSDSEISAYWESGEPLDKAGAYAIQGLGAMFVNNIQGSYSGVVGLPVYETVALLGKFGLDTTSLLIRGS